jgi:hypothetical protein
MYEMRSDFMGEVVGFGVVFIGGGRVVWIEV